MVTSFVLMSNVFLILVVVGFASVSYIGQCSQCKNKAIGRPHDLLFGHWVAWRDGWCLPIEWTNAVKKIPSRWPVDKLKGFYRAVGQTHKSLEQRNARVQIMRKLSFVGVLVS